MIDTLWQDVRLAVRMMTRQKAFTAAALATLALGIGANTAIFSVVHGVLLRPLPYPDPERLVRVAEVHPGANAPVAAPLVSHSTYNAWREAPATVEDLGAYNNRAFIVGGERARLRGAGLAPQLFTLLGASPVLGRAFVEPDAAEGAPPVAVLSHALWMERFAGDPGVLGETIDLDGQPHAIVGVMPEGFAFPDRASRLWTPYRVPPTAAVEGLSVFTAIARLRSGVTPAQAAAEGTAAARGAGRNETIANLIFGAGAPVEVEVRTLLDDLTSDVRPALLVLLAGVGLVLLIACANVANLFLSRGAARQREIAIRAAVGAGTARLVRQLLTESVVLGVAGGALGVAFGWALTRALPSLAPAGFPRLDDVAVDGRVLAFAAGVSLAAGVLAGLLPAWRGARPDLVPALRESAGVSGGPRARRLRTALLVGEAAVAVVLLVGAGLLARSFVQLVQVDAGYDAGSVVTARLHLPGPAQTPERVSAVVDGLLERLRADGRVVAAGAGNMAPLSGSTAITGFTLRDATGQEREARALAYTVTDGYAEALGLRLREGRLLSPADVGAAQEAMLVNEEFVRTYLTDGAAVVGRQIPGMPQAPGAPERLTEIVGVVGNVLKDGLDRRPQPELYRLPRDGRGLLREVNLVVRTVGDPLAVVPALRETLASVDAEAVLDPVATLASQVDRSVGEPRFAAFVLGAFALLALVLAATGLYGVLSHSVAQRQKEMGVRLALGASRGQIVRLILREGLAVTGAGLALGLMIAVGATRLMEGLLFGVARTDAVTFAAAPALLAVVAAITCAVPARRAAAADPAQALRAE